MRFWILLLSLSALSLAANKPDKDSKSDKGDKNDKHNKSKPQPKVDTTVYNILPKNSKHEPPTYACPKEDVLECEKNERLPGGKGAENYLQCQLKNDKGEWWYYVDKWQWVQEKDVKCMARESKDGVLGEWIEVNKSHCQNWYIQDCDVTITWPDHHDDTLGNTFDSTHTVAGDCAKVPEKNKVLWFGTKRPGYILNLSNYDQYVCAVYGKYDKKSKSNKCQNFLEYVGGKLYAENLRDDARAVICW